MDTSLNAHAKLDIASDVLRIDVRGSLTQHSRPTLMHLIQRVRRMGITSHIRVHLGNAAFVESAALSGLRNDLTWKQASPRCRPSTSRRTSPRPSTPRGPGR